MILWVPVVCLICSWQSALAQEARVRLRQIVVNTQEEAVDIRARVEAGAPFEALARELSQDFSASRGGYLGSLSPSDLRAELREAITGLLPGEVSVPVQIGQQYYLLLPVDEAEADWIDLDETGLRALDQGRDREAEAAFEAAVRQAQASGADYRLGRSLINLAEVYRLGERPVDAEPLYRSALPILEQVHGRAHPDVGQAWNSLGLVLYAQGEHAEAETAYQQSLEVRETTLGSQDPAVATTLNNLAQLYRAQSRFEEAAPLYERSLAILEGTLGPDHPATNASLANLTAFRTALLRDRLPDLLERLAMIVSTANYRDEVFDQGFQEFLELLAQTPLSEQSYMDMKDALVEVDLHAQAEAVMTYVVERFPDSRTMRFYMADLLATDGKSREAMEVFRQATEMRADPGLDPASDIQQHGFLYQRIGDMHTNLFEFEEAEAAYLRALEIDPYSPGCRISLGNLYLDTNRLDEALEQYSLAPVEEDQAGALYAGMAEVNFALQRWEETAVAAERVLELDPSEPQAHYFKGQALLRLGRREEGTSALQEFNRLNTEAQAEEERYRRIDAAMSDGLNAVLRGEPEAAIEIFRAGIDAFPETGEIYMSLALTYRRLGRHLEAAETFQSMIDLEISDHYLTYKYLAEAHEANDDPVAAERNYATYLEKREAEVRSALPE